MNLPVNNPILKDLFLDQISSDKLFFDLNQRKFNGYVYLTIKGEFGFEESFIIFEKGNIVGNIYVLEGYDIELFGSEAFNLCINAFGAENGVLNIYDLKEDQIKLVLIFNDKIKNIKQIVSKNKNSKKNYFLKNIKYNPNAIQELLTEKININKSQKDLFSERGLDQLLGKSE
jgi:hypothetical protein